MIIPKMPHRIFILIYIAAERSINMTVYEEIFEVIKKRKAEFDSGTAQENSTPVIFLKRALIKYARKSEKRPQKL